MAFKPTAPARHAPETNVDGPRCAGCGRPGKVYTATDPRCARVAGHCIRCSWALTPDDEDDE